MKMELWQRKSKKLGKLVFDVYVINDPDETSPYHAGGMPEKWLIVHCATADEIKRRFPNSTRADGSPLVKSAKGAKPIASDADVDIKLVIDKAMVEEFVSQANESVKAEDKELKNETEQTNVESKDPKGDTRESQIEIAEVKQLAATASN